MIRRINTLLVLSSLLAVPAAAQTDARLVTAVRLAQEGMGDSARAVVGRILAATPPTDPLYPEVLYTVAVVASSAPDKRLYLQRVAVEYSQSDWADDALLQLAQLDYAGRNPAGTVQQIERLLADYPGSPVRATAALWGARAAFDQRDRALACQWVNLGLGAVGDDVELRNQLDYQHERCRAMAAADSTSAQRPPPKPSGPQWLVQVAAFKTRDAADDAVANLKKFGYGAFITTDGDYLRVRAGPFASKAEAQAAVDRIRQRLKGQPFVTRAPVP